MLKMDLPEIPSRSQQGVTSPKSGETNGLTPGSEEHSTAEADKRSDRQGLDHVENFSLVNKDDQYKGDTFQFIFIDEGTEVGTSSGAILNSFQKSLINGAGGGLNDCNAPFRNTDVCKTLIEGTKRKFTVDLVPEATASIHHVPTTLQGGDHDGIIPAYHDGTSEASHCLVNQVTVQDLPETFSSFSSQEEIHKNSVGNTEGLEVEELQDLLNEDERFERECPICTELYDASNHKQSLLNCNHVFCDNCIQTMVNKASLANLGRVTCPLCRQTSPMMECEIRRMQEQMMESGGNCVQQRYDVSVEPLVRRPGLCGTLEYRFRERVQNGRLFLMCPCIRNQQRLVNRLDRLEQRCRCLYLCALVFLMFSEYFFFLFLFVPIVIFILMIVFGK
ncbi:ring finger protein-like [Hyperolius riggenbachi]|uniref:ring finger protein-like n=1 Tax=Hyperolius riggenbachi TaxID=752182 RepID=UPI0035A3BE54